MKPKISSLVLIAFLLSCHQAIAAEGKTVFPAENPNFPFSEAVLYGGVLYLSGELGILSNGKLADGGIEAEARQAMDNIRRKLKRHKLAMNDIIKCTVFLADIAEWPAFNSVYKPYFEVGQYPARSALAASGLALNARVEIECIAAYDSE